MRFNIFIPALDVTITNDQGQTIGEYSLREYKINADINGLIAAGLKIRDEATKALANAEVQKALNEAKVATQQ